MTDIEETNERNACDEWWHAEKRGASVQQAWLERARRAKAHPIYQVKGGVLYGKVHWIDVTKEHYDRASDSGIEEFRIVYVMEPS